MIAEVPRLLLRPIAASDAEAMQAVLSDAKVVAFGMSVLFSATRSVRMLLAGEVVLRFIGSWRIRVELILLKLCARNNVLFLEGLDFFCRVV